jgi:hypothetical protein
MDDGSGAGKVMHHLVIIGGSLSLSLSLSRTLSLSLSLSLFVYICGYSSTVLASSTTIP